MILFDLMNNTFFKIDNKFVKQNCLKLVKKYNIKVKNSRVITLKSKQRKKHEKCL